ncbi:TlpA family protein disulfide reductase [Mucilaginibacter sp. Mucisp84]|uniref:TlpA family protein disulfide reductase n=1 Tax=Mucilaginibacter sp. Mucisp84 TaxID=3243058 RepID=UPI0039A7433F
MIKKIFSLSLCFLMWLNVAGETAKARMDTIKIGDILPNFILKDLQYFKKKNISLEDLKGHWTVLDFFASTCSSCVASFPEINRLNKKLANKVQFILIGFTNKSIKPMFEKFREKEHLNLPVAYDSSLFRKYNIVSVPFQIILDGNGVVRGTENSLNENDLNNYLINNKLPDSSILKTTAKDGNHYSFDGTKPFLINRNGGADTSFTYRSVFSVWNKSIPEYYLQDDLNYCMKVIKGKVQFLGIDLSTLYRMAYLGYGNWGGGDFDDSLYGKFLSWPILEIKNPDAFKPDFTHDKNLYCYSLIYPPRITDKRKVMAMMQNDLKNIFPYEVEIETRKVKYWKITATEKGRVKLLTKGDTTFMNMIPHAGFTAKNFPIQNLIRMLWAHHEDKVFIDETNIKGNIDIKLDCIMTDLNDVKKALQKNELDLVEGQKDMKVLVIRDAPPL